MARDLKFNLRVAAREAEAELKNASKAARELGDDLEDTGKTKAQRLADGMKRVADDVDREIDDMKAAADALGAALGPELAARVDTASVVTELRMVGLTADDIKADADALADALRRVDQVNMRGVRTEADDIQTGFRNVGTEADQTRSVVANFAGNAAQELPGVTGAMGPLNMAIGQFAEYASEGNIKMSNFIKAGAGLAGLSVAMWAISKGAEQAAKRTREIEEAMSDLGRVSDQEALRRFYEDILTNAILNGDDLKQTLDELVESSPEAARRLLKIGEEAGQTGGEMALLRESIIEYEREEAQAKRTSEEFADEISGVGDESRGSAPHVEELARQAASYEGKAREAERATQEFADAVEARLKGISSEQSWLEIKGKLDQFVLDMNEAGLSADEQRLKVLDLTEELITYVSELEGVPQEKKTEILALIDAESFRLVEVELAKLERSRFPVYTPQFRSPGGGGPVYGAEGGIVTRPTLAVIGEAGPEAVIPLHSTPGSSPLPSGIGVGAMPTYGSPSAGMTVNVYTQADERRVLDVIRRYERRGGKSPWN